MASLRQTPALEFTPVLSPVSVWAASDSSHWCVRAVSVNREGKHRITKGPQGLHNGVLSLWQAVILWLASAPMKYSPPQHVPCLDTRPSCLYLHPPGSALTVPYTWHPSPFGLLE